MKFRIFALSLFLPILGQAFQPSLDDSVSMEAYFDGVIETHLRDKNIAGATLAVVHNGKTKILKGYGYSDVANKTEVDPNSTLFRIGSITKLFTWTAIMQLVERGEINLDDNVNDFLEGFKIPDTYDQPITIKHLMSHTPGFEDEIIGLFALDESAIKPLGDILKEEMPARVRPPGVHSSYSNHGTGMAAYIVEQVTGQDFDDYVEQHILNPLDMNRATTRQPLPPSLSPLMSKGYIHANGEFVEKPFEFVPLGPVGTASAASGSMIHLMNMYLNHGSLNGQSILDSTTLALMASTAHQHHPAVNPMRHGFMDVSQNGQTIIGHGGDTFWFHSLMALFTDHNLGVFLSFNSEAGGMTYLEVLEDFTDRYFPEEVDDITPNASEDLTAYVGEYAVNRYSHDDILKIGKMMSVVNVEADPEGYLITKFMGNAEKWIKQDDLVFRNENNSDVFVFERGENGRIQHAFWGGLPIMALDRLNGFDKTSIHTNLFIILSLLMLGAFVYWNVTYSIRRKHKIERDLSKVLPSYVKKPMWWALGLLFTFYVGFGLLFSDPLSTIYGLPPIAYVVFSIPILVVIVGVYSAWPLVRTWKEASSVNMWRKLSISLIWLALMITIWQWNYWNWIGYNF